MEAREFIVELECSFITNKRRVYLNQGLEFAGSKPYGQTFEYRIFSENHVFCIRNSGGEADLYIDEVSFKQAYARKLWKRKIPKDFLEFN